MIPKKVELCDSIFWALLKIEVFPFFHGNILEIEELYGPNGTDVDIDIKKSSSFLQFWIQWDPAKRSSFNSLALADF